MEFRNLTPFSTLCYLAEDAQAQRWRVVAIKVGYRLAQEGDQWQARVMDEEPEVLCLADEHWGDPASTSIRQESDLAPFKPRCDVLLRGSSHAPGGKPAPQWLARLRISVNTPAPVEAEPQRPRPLNPFMGLTANQLEQWERAKAMHHKRQAAKLPGTDKLLLDKALRISGPSQFRRLPLLGWRRSAVEPALAVALRWEHSLGGSCRVETQPAASAGTSDPPAPPAPLLNEACYSNPLGCGWLEQRWERALAKARRPQPKALPAPQIEAVDAPPLAAPLRCKHPNGELDARGMRDVAGRYAQQPAGFAALGRAWAPRLALAGSYDRQWLDQQHPLPPQDFDDGYWNAAPADQQLAAWPGADGHPVAVRLELTNLCASSLAPDGIVSVELPPHQAFVMARLHDGRVLPLQMQTDTVLIDTDAMTVSLTHRLRLSAELPLRVLEARFECDPEAALLQWDDGDAPAPGAVSLNTLPEPA